MNKIREIYFRDPSDPKYQLYGIETNDKLGAVIAKLRIILFTNRGEVLGEPDLGMDLEDFLFDFGFNEQIIRERFYAQIAKYIPERDFRIDLDVSYETDGVRDTAYLFIIVNDLRVLGISV